MFLSSLFTIFGIPFYNIDKLASSWAHFKQNFKSFQSFTGDKFLT